MKTAEEWEGIFNQEYGLAIASVKRIRAIQLDSLNEAAEIADRIALQDCEAGDACEIRDAILARIRELESSPENK